VFVNVFCGVTEAVDVLVKVPVLVGDAVFVHVFVIVGVNVGDGGVPVHVGEILGVVDGVSGFVKVAVAV